MRAAWLWAGSVSVVLIGVLGLALLRAGKDDEPPLRSEEDAEAHDKAVLKAWLDDDWSSPEDTPWTWRRVWRWVVRVVRRGR